MAPFNPDWSKLEATQQSLRDHMALVNAAQEREQQFRATVAAALPESWYADSPPEFRIQKMVEQWQKLHKREKEVAAALRELRASVAAERSALFAPILAEIDATIAALGLADEALEETK